MNQLKIGILSYQAINLPHEQCERGVTTDLPSGMRRMQTFKKLPVQAPM